MKIQALHVLKPKPIIALKFKASAVSRVLPMHCTEENKLKHSFNSTTRMEISVKLMVRQNAFLLIYRLYAGCQMRAGSLIYALCRYGFKAEFGRVLIDLNIMIWSIRHYMCSLWT